VMVRIWRYLSPLRMQNQFTRLQLGGKWKKGKWKCLDLILSATNEEIINVYKNACAAAVTLFVSMDCEFGGILLPQSIY
jgi:hypothetical protein